MSLTFIRSSLRCPPFELDSTKKKGKEKVYNTATLLPNFKPNLLFAAKAPSSSPPQSPPYVRTLRLQEEVLAHLHEQRDLLQYRLSEVTTQIPAFKEFINTLKESNTNAGVVSNGE